MFHHHEKVKVTIECNADERAKPNKATLEAHKEALRGKGVACENLEDFWKQMGVKLF